MGRAQLQTLLSRHCRAQGYAVESVVSGAMGAKFGDAIDLVLRRDDEFVLLQSKYWAATSVSLDAVHAFLDVMADLDATGGILVTGGTFSSDAVELASRQGRVELVDGETLRSLLAPIQALDDEPPSSDGADVFDRAAHAGDGVDWLTLLAGDATRPAGRGGAPTGGLLLWSLGLKLTFAFALVLLFAWAIDAAVHPLLQPLRLHRVAGDAAESHVVPVAQSARQDAGDDATADAWHQPSQDEILEQQRKAGDALKPIGEDTPVTQSAALHRP